MSRPAWARHSRKDNSLLSLRFGSDLPNRLGRGFSPALLAGVVFAALVALAAYAPGLGGGFVLDDEANLAGLGRIEGPAGWYQLASYVFLGANDVGNRYIPLLSFALQYQSWPADPASFKLVNLVLHLVDAGLLFWLFAQAGALAGLSARDRVRVALLAAVFWLLHPLAVSTTLYVVQRMTQFCTLFTLGGLLAYVHGRRRLAEGRPGGYGWMSAGVAAGGVLAVFSKETGVLLPLYVLALEATLFCRLSRGRGWHLWAAAFIYIPLLAVVAYLAALFGTTLGSAYRLRDFGPWERLLTEARVLVDYLQMILLPRPSLLGVFHDDYPVSRGFLDPPQTLAAVPVIVALLGSAVALRSRAPAYGFAVLWFLGGHALESTVIPLELYFEHRNYLPMAGILWALAYYVWKGWSDLARLPLRYLSLGFGLVWLALLAVLTFSEARIWGNPLAQAITWAREHPGSARAQLYGAAAWLALGDAGNAQNAYALAARGTLREPGGYTYWLVASCVNPAITPPDFEEAAEALRTARFSHAALGGLAQVARLKEEGRCDRILNYHIGGMFFALLANPNYDARRRNLFVALGRIQAASGELDEAMRSFEQAFRVAPRVDIALLQVKLLASAGRQGEARAYVDKARAANGGWLLSRTVFEKEITDWEQALQQAR